MTTTPTRLTSQRDGSSGRAVHDVGGLDLGAIDRSEHDLALWEKRTDAMLILLATKAGAFKIDAMRRVIEDYDQQAYDRTTYYEKWIRAVRNLIVEQEIVRPEEIDQRMLELAEHYRACGRAVDAGRIDWPEESGQ